MKKKLDFAAMFICVLVLGLFLISCDAFSGDRNNPTTIPVSIDTFNLHANAEPTTTHQIFFDFTLSGLNVIVDPTNVHEKEFSAAQRKQIIEHLKETHGYNLFPNQTESQVLTLLNVAVADGLPDMYVQQIIDIIKSRGWVVFLYRQNDGEQNLVVIEKN